MTVLDRIVNIVRDALDDPALTLTPATGAGDVPGWDSMKHVLIVLEIEESFGITLASREIDRAKNIGDLADLVSSKIPAPPSGKP